MKSIVLLNSGGLDSAWLAYKLKNEGFEIHSLYINFNIPNSAVTSKAAEETAKRYCVDHKVLNLDFGMPVDHISNMTMLSASIGVAWAKMNGIMEVYTGATGAVDEDFINRYNEVNQGRTIDRVKPQLVTPLYGIRPRGETAKMCGVENILDFSYTHTCRFEIPCGECQQCKNRAELGV